MRLSRRLAFGAIAALSLAAVGAALVSQHVYDMQPCPWCVLQRLIFVAIALVAVIGLAWTSRSGTLVAAAGIDLLASAGFAAAMWQHFVAASSTSCNQTLADKIINGLGLDGLLPEIFAPRASCADAAVNLLGMPYEFWSAALFVTFLAAAAVMLVSAGRAGSSARR
jgi:protein dithiol:quinone oxidoreductase